VGHVSVAHPVCPRLGDALEHSARGLGLDVTRGGTYLVMEGPQFSTKAESELYRSWGCSVIGMTNMPEAKLAREAEICYATVAMVTDFDCWHPDHDAVTVDQVVKFLLGNADKARALVRSVVPAIGAARGPCPAGCDRALDHAIITAPDKRDPALMAKLGAVAARVL
jgi:5'-methylthioadenosine phosphorylase